MIAAACLCGAIAWEIEGEPQFVTHCHCSRCRKTHGAAFATYGIVPESAIRCTKGEDRIRWYQSSKENRRPFCPDCGSALVAEPWNGLVGVPFGLLDGDPGARAIGHIFAASKADWFEITDELVAHDTWPASFDGPVIEDRPARFASGQQGGSCDCGAVRFEITGDVVTCRNCHCSRCRKARSAAHASNLGVKMGDLRWASGEENRVRYEVPGAKRFAQVFCKDCGSPVPCEYPSLERYVVPMGSLDTDLGAKPTEHIFVGSKAPWYEIPDGLPQYDEYSPQ